jgi:hypothetical protein
MKDYYDNESLVVFNELLDSNVSDLASIRKYKFKSKFRSTRRYQESEPVVDPEAQMGRLERKSRDSSSVRKYYLTQA